jgi:predicted RNase H-like nuclease
MKLAGIDLAWRSDKNPTALAIGALNGHELVLMDVAKDLFAIDGPLLIENSSGQRKTGWLGCWIPQASLQHFCDCTI